MAFFDYECLKCNYQFELRKSINDPHPTICPECGEQALVQVHLHAPAVDFKGPGWFKTDGKY
jgi:putative FmdB family regulatory protein